MIDTVASIATAVGVFLVAVQLWMVRRTFVGDFEQTFNARYRELSDRLPMELLRGELELRKPLTESEERACRLYLELCEDELYFRKHGRVSSSTWVDWWVGIENSTRWPPMRSLVEESERQHVLLRSAMAADGFPDPANSSFRRWAARRISGRRTNAGTVQEAGHG